MTIFNTQLDWAGLSAADAPGSGLILRGATAQSIAGRASGLIYLSVPYAREVLAGGRWRFEKSVELAGRAAFAMHQLAAAGCVAVAPVVMWAEMAHAATILPQRDRLDPLDEERCATWSQPFLNAASLVVVPDVPGWHRSIRVWNDVTWAIERNMPVHFMGVAPR